MKTAATIDQLREELARLILAEALKSDNPQFQLDAYKATQDRAKPRHSVETAGPGMDGMAIFQARVKKAEGEGTRDGTDQ